MKLYKEFILSVTCGSLIIMSQITNAATDKTITYKNQRGSTMNLIFHANQGNTGTLEGTFTTAVGNCLADVNVPLPLTGYYNGNAISVTVNFPHCKQVVAMTGNLSNDFKKLHTLWLDANQADDPNGQDWNSNIVGTDVYNKIDK